MNDYVIIGDTDEYGACLVYICGTLDHAEEILERMLTNPTDNDKQVMQGHYNFRIEEIPEIDCWWHGNCD